MVGIKGNKKLLVQFNILCMIYLVMDTGLHTRTGLRVRVSRARVQVSIFSPVAHPHP